MVLESACRVCIDSNRCKANIEYQIKPSSEDDAHPYRFCPHYSTHSSLIMSTERGPRAAQVLQPWLLLLKLTSFNTPLTLSLNSPSSSFLLPPLVQKVAEVGKTRSNAAPAVPSPFIYLTHPSRDRDNKYANTKKREGLDLRKRGQDENAGA